MADSLLDELLMKLEQTGYLISCIQKDLESGDCQSAQIGICLALDLIEDMKKILLDHRADS